MSELGQPKEPQWTNIEDEFIIEHSYMTVKELASNLNRTEAAVRGRKSKLGVKRGSCKPFTDKEKEIIQEWYTKENTGVDLKELSKILNRPKTSISAIARKMGLTKYGNFTKKERQLRGEKMKIKVDNMVHPRGMLGKHHTKDARNKMSVFQLQRAANMSQEEKHEIAMKAVKTRMQKGTLNNTTSNAYSRTKSGIRKDLGQYFRSSWEANIARILNYENIEWMYETKRFVFKEEINGVISYQPDFYLPEQNKWIEVKGWMDEKSKLRLQLFKEQYPEESKNLIIIDQDFYNALRLEFFYLSNWEDYAKNIKKPRKNYDEILKAKEGRIQEEISNEFMCSKYSLNKSSDVSW